ncbi:hypothetical protein [Amycolatopsis sp. CB00013]|uniref:hypothetical protein n=1 Tax=Amycolatopsis sp. CB00013 TaxID=1703945 RepID=UPI00093C9405|nr:hypothetical protein [Amycolatopsis sp. CB00013]OKJ98781.1 hypothetical protein AMK34_18315 [Amycolatopsis sp. CB00013]
MKDWIPLIQSLIWPVPRESASAEPRPDTTGVNTIHLAHTARREKQLDRDNYQYHGIHAFLVGDDDRDLDRVTKVVYHLHPFNLTADVHLEGRATPLRLERYINF